MGFQQGLSGLNAQAKNLEVIGNNIANVSTIGFKKSRAEFADIYASTLASSSTTVGLGTRLATVSQQFTQGDITSTDNSLDVAISGNGFFRVEDTGGTVYYTRDGEFELNKDGYLRMGTTKYLLTGWPVDSNTGLILTGSEPSPLQLTVSNIGARATGSTTGTGSGVQLGVNLDSSSSIINRATTPLSTTDASTYTHSTTATVYDSLGNDHTLTLYYTKTAANTWEVQSSFDGAAPVNVGSNLSFDTNGNIITGGASTFTYSTTLTNGATSPFSFSVDMSKSTQYNDDFTVNSLTQDGYAPGVLTGITISDEGIIQGKYSNSQTRTIGQIVLANFTNVQGLQSVGNNCWVESYDSGQARVSTPGSGDFGTLQSNALESSKVDLTEELVNLITAQRNYQANAKTISTEDTIMQTLVNL